jgi:hypothetical protein
MYAFVYALLIGSIDLRAIRYENLRTKITEHPAERAPSRTRTDTGRILSPSWEATGFQNFGILSLAQSRNLRILVVVYAFVYAFIK